MAAQLPTTKESDLPWQPLFTIERSGRKEVTVYGIVCLVSGFDSSSKLQSIDTVRPLVQLGDINYQLWSRSLLKPWQDVYKRQLQYFGENRHGRR